MVDKGFMTMWQLQSYKAWLEKSRAEDRVKFKAENHKMKDFTQSAKNSWYENEFAQVNHWIEAKERDNVRKEMELKANKFLNPAPISVTNGTPRKVKGSLRDIKAFLISLGR